MGSSTRNELSYTVSGTPADQYDKLKWGTISGPIRQNDSITDWMTSDGKPVLESDKLILSAPKYGEQRVPSSQAFVGASFSPDGNLMDVNGNLILGPPMVYHSRGVN